MSVWDHIIELRREMRARRPGFYAATVSAAGDALRRSQIVPEWMGDGALERALSIQSPILDVRPSVGATVAVIGRDGLPERPAILGVLWDRVPTLTVWLRADLARHAGHVELGATRSVRVRVGPDPGEIAALADGRISIGNGVGEVVADLAVVCEQLASVTSALAATAGSIAAAAAASPATPVTNATLATLLTAGGAGLSPTTLTPIATALATVQGKINSMRA